MALAVGPCAHAAGACGSAHAGAAWAMRRCMHLGCSRRCRSSACTSRPSAARACGGCTGQEGRAVTRTGRRTASCLPLQMMSAPVSCNVSGFDGRQRLWQRMQALEVAVRRRVRPPKHPTRCRARGGTRSHVSTGHEAMGIRSESERARHTVAHRAPMAAGPSWCARMCAGCERSRCLRAHRRWRHGALVVLHLLRSCSLCSDGDRRSAAQHSRRPMDWRGPVRPSAAQGCLRRWHRSCKAP